MTLIGFTEDLTEQDLVFQTLWSTYYGYALSKALFGAEGYTAHHTQHGFPLRFSSVNNPGDDVRIHWDGLGIAEGSNKDKHYGTVTAYLPSVKSASSTLGALFAVATGVPAHLTPDGAPKPHILWDNRLIPGDEFVQIGRDIINEGGSLGTA